MPRAGVHARRDLATLRPALAALGLAVTEDFERALLDRHRAIDRNQDEEDQHLHFMRGHDEQDAPEALRRALGHARACAEAALGKLADDLERPGPNARLALARALADALHVVRDSYSSGHATRAPRGTGPVVAMRAWELDRRAERGFGLVHVLRHDLRFERPFAWFAREVRASDAAVADLVLLLSDAARAPAPERRARFEEAWARFVEERFLPPSRPMPREHERAGAPGAA